MNLQQLRYVKALVDKGSFVAAASCCSVTQPTLSNGLAQLENELGHRLFRRTTRSVKLTPYGERLLPTILEILSLFERLKQLSKDGGADTTTLQVGISPLVGVRRAAKILARFRAKYPSVDVVFRESNLDGLCNSLNRGAFDLVIAPCNADLHLAADCVCLSIEMDPLLFLPKAGERSKWRDVESVALSDIAGETFVLMPDNCGLTRVTARLFDESRLELKRYAGEASAYAAIQEFAEAGVAAGILPVSKFQEQDELAIPIVQDGRPVALEYFVLGKPSTIPQELFRQLWDSLLEVKSALKRKSPAEEFAELMGLGFQLNN